MDVPGKSLKSKNLGFIWAILIVDILTLIGFLYPANIEKTTEYLSSVMRLCPAMMPVIALLITSILSPDMKAMIVFLKAHNILPGHRAFSLYMKKDSRVDPQVLSKKYGELPNIPKEENLFWYKLFKRVEYEASVSHAHQYYLLFRDIAALSILLGITLPVITMILGFEILTTISIAFIFLTQYIVSLIAARNYGIRLVTNVLAIHSLN